MTALDATESTVLDSPYQQVAPLPMAQVGGRRWNLKMCIFQVPLQCNRVFTKGSASLHRETARLACNSLTEGA